jgi:hypothetical protein
MQPSINRQPEQVNNSADARVLAAQYRALGLALCKPDPGTKSPRYEHWPTRSLEPEEFAAGDLIGIICGPLSHRNLLGHALIIVDLDDVTAVEQADQYLPATGMVEGRPGKLRSHRYFLVPLDSVPPWAESPAEQGAAAARQATGHPGPWKKAFNHAETKIRLIDFLGTGGQAVCPSPGNERTWTGGSPGEPAVVPFVELWEATCRLAEACGGALPEIAQPSWERSGRFSGPGRRKIARPRCSLRSGPSAGTGIHPRRVCGAMGVAPSGLTGAGPAGSVRLIRPGPPGSRSPPAAPP